MTKFKQARIYLAGILTLCLTLSLTAAEGPLANRLIQSDGDRSYVPLWQWLNDLTGDNAAVVLTEAGDLARISLPRMWRKGQTIGQVVKGSESFLGDFKINFLRQSLTLVSLTALEKLESDEYRKAIFISEWGGWPKLGLEAWGGLMHASGIASEAELFACFGAGLALGFSPSFEALLRIEGGLGEAKSGGTTFDASKLNLLLGLRWRIFPEWVITPYLMTGGVFTLYSEKSGAENRSWTGVGLAVAGGLAFNLLDELSLLVEYGRTWSFIPNHRLDFGELRAGFSWRM